VTETSRCVAGICRERKQYLLVVVRRHFSKRMGQIRPHLFFVMAGADAVTVGSLAKPVLSIAYGNDGH